jgi:hypothetical protein
MAPAAMGRWPGAGERGTMSHHFCGVTGSIWVLHEKDKLLFPAIWGSTRDQSSQKDKLFISILHFNCSLLSSAFGDLEPWKLTVWRCSSAYLRLSKSLASEGLPHHRSKRISAQLGVPGVVKWELYSGPAQRTVQSLSSTRMVES